MFIMSLARNLLNALMLQLDTPKKVKTILGSLKLN